MKVEGVAPSAALDDVTLVAKKSKQPDKDLTAEEKFTVIKLDLIAYTGTSPAEIPEDKEEDPGAWVGMNADNDDNLGGRDRDQITNLPIANENDLVKLRLDYAGPGGVGNKFKLRIEEAAGGAGRVKIWSSANKQPNTLVLDGTSKPSAEVELTPTSFPADYYVEGYELSSPLRDVVVSFGPSTAMQLADKVNYTVIGIDAVKSMDQFRRRMLYLPLVRRTFELTDDEKVRERAKDMSFALHVFEPGAGPEAGAWVRSYKANGTDLIEEEKGDLNDLDVQTAGVGGHYAGWDDDPPWPFGTDAVRGFIVENDPASSALWDYLDTILGEAGGKVRILTTEAGAFQKVNEPGFECEVLGSNLILKRPGAGAADPEILELFLHVNNDDDDADTHPDNFDNAITGTAAQKAADRSDMAQLTLAAMLPASRPAGKITLSRESGAGVVRLFKAADDSHYWTSNTPAKDVGALAAEENYLVEGVEPGELVLRLEYQSNDGLLKWYDRVRMIIVSVSVNVHASDPETYQVESILPAVNNPLYHFVTARQQGDVVLQAIVMPDTPEVRGLITWTTTAPGIALTSPAVGSDRRTVKFSCRFDQGRKISIQGRVADAPMRSIVCWVVSADMAGAVAAPVATPITTPAGLRIGTSVSAAIAPVATIRPAEIVTDPDRPNLTGPNVLPNLGGTNVSGAPLAGGVNARWDISRRIAIRAVTNPAGLPLAPVDGER